MSAPAFPPHGAVAAALTLATRILASVRGRRTVRAASEGCWWIWTVVLMAPMLIAHPANAQVTECISCGVPYRVEVTPDGFAEPLRAVNSGPFTASFVVRNSGDNSDIYDLSCLATGPITCGSLSQTILGLGTFSQATITVQYTTGGPGTGSINLTATSRTSELAVDGGSYAVTAVAPPVVSLVAPVLTTGSRAMVRTRQPLIRALFASNGSGVDSTTTVLQWKGTTVTSQARANRGLVEWEVDSTRWLAVGDSALISVTACAGGGVACTTVTRYAVLLNDQKPVLGFTGAPLEALGSQFGAPFGPGLSVSGAEVETGFGTTPYFSMGAARSFGLSYSTRQSYPRALVPVDLELPWPAGTPDQIKLVLLDGASRLDSLVLASPTCATGALKRCRAVLQGDFSALTFPAPTRKWLTVEASITSGAVTKMGSDSVEVVLVDRRATPYGNGWWPSMFAKLVQAGNDRLLVGATGAVTVFRGQGDSLYLAPPGNLTVLTRTPTGWELKPRGSTAKLVFDASGRLSKSIDRNGNFDQLSYSGTTDQITSWLDPVGKTTTVAYDGAGKLQTITDPGSRQNRVTVGGTASTLNYDSLASGPAPAGPYTNTYVYRTYGSAVVLMKRIGVVLDTTIVTYDSTWRRRPTQARLPQVQDETGAVVNPIIKVIPYERQGYGSLVSLDLVYVELKDPRNNWTRSLLNRWGQSRKTWDVIGILSQTRYDPDGFTLWTQGKVADSSRVYSAYDALKRLVKTYIVRTAADTLRLDSLVYDGNHRVVKRIDSRGRADSLKYDAAGNVILTRDPDGNVSQIWYRANGQVDSTRAPGVSSSTRYSYDATWKQVANVWDPAGDQLTQNTYDNYGRDSTASRRIRVQLTATADTLQWRRTTTYYNVANQVDSTVLQRTDSCASPCSTATWLPTSDISHTQRVSHRYNRAGQDSVRLNDRGSATTYIYDRLGRVIRRTDPAGAKDSMAYDIAGNLAKSITRRGDVLTSNYDTRNRAVATVIPGVGTLTPVYAGPSDQLTRLYYATPVDSIGGVNGEIRWGYDQRGRLKADSSYTGSTARRTTYSYDTYERPSTMVDPLGTWVTRYESTRGYPDTLLTPFADTLMYTFDPQGRAIGPTVGSSGPRQQRTLSWLDTGKLNSLTTSVAGSVAFTAGNYFRGATSAEEFPALEPMWAEQPGHGTPSITRIDSVTYDGWERVKRWRNSKNGSPYASEVVNYDRMGNVYTLAEAEVYDTVTEHLQSLTVGGHKYFYGYDPAGNLVQQRDSTLSSGVVVTMTYGYDALNQLRSVRQGATLIARYGYDVSGRRIAKRVYSTATGGTVAYTRFVYHGSHVAFEADSGTVAGGAIGLRYTWGQGTDDLVGVRDAAGVQYYTTQDKLGSIRALVKRDGTWVLNMTYGPWGRVVDSAGTQQAMLRYRWTGREFDSETGFYFHRSRYYSPAQRRFVQEDPIGYSGSSNLYSYVEGQVLEATDPGGMMLRFSDAGGSSAGTPRWDGGPGGARDGGGFDPFGEQLGRDLLGDQDANYEAWVAGGSLTEDGERAVLTRGDASSGAAQGPKPGSKIIFGDGGYAWMDASRKGGEIAHIQVYDRLGNKIGYINPATSEAFRHGGLDPSIPRSYYRELAEGGWLTAKPSWANPVRWSKWIAKGGITLTVLGIALQVYDVLFDVPSLY